MTQPKVAIVYDWVTSQYGGAEKVLLALHDAFPDAPLFTSIYEPTVATWAKVFRVKTSWLQKLPLAGKLYRWLSVLMPLAFESLDLSEFEVILSVSSAQAKGVITKPSQLHLSYVLTPTRYLYTHESEYVQHYPVLLRPLIKLAFKYLRWWDEAAASRPDYLIPISQVVADRTEEYYHRKTLPVISPPVQVPDKSPKTLPFSLPEKYYVVVSRLVEYKGIEAAIKACIRLKTHLVVIGEGPLKGKLQSLAQGQPHIQFLPPQSDDVVYEVMRGAQGLLMPGVEDFGIVALEATALGVPAIIHQKSGVAEVLKDGVHAFHLSQTSASEIEKAMEKREKSHLNPKVLTQNTQEYVTTTFVLKFQETVSRLWREWNQGRTT